MRKEKKKEILSFATSVWLHYTKLFIWAQHIQLLNTITWFPDRLLPKHLLLPHPSQPLLLPLPSLTLLLECRTLCVTTVTQHCEKCSVLKLTNTFPQVQRLWKVPNCTQQNANFSMEPGAWVFKTKNSKGMEITRITIPTTISSSQGKNNQDKRKKWIKH